MNIHLDIETLPTARADVVAYIEEGMRDELQAALDAVCAPGNYKDEAKIAEFCDNKRAALKAEFVDKLAQKVKSTGVDGSFGRVCVIGWALDDGEVQVLQSDCEERRLLENFAHLIDKQIPHKERFTTTVVGHNVQWDVRFLTQRYIVNGIRPPQVIARAVESKPWEKDRLYDTMVQWAGVGGKISLDRLCLALSIPSPKGELDGSKVAEWVEAGKIDEVATYCCGDVRAVREVWRRMTFNTVEVLEDVPA